MKNPLSLEEKLAVRKLIGHDLKGVLSVILQNSGSKDGRFPEPSKEESYVVHICEIISSIELLSEENVQIFDRVDNENLERELIDLTKFLKYRKKIDAQYSIEINDDFNSFDSLIYSALYNLAKNAQQFTKPEDRKISVHISQFSGVIPIADYISHEMPLEGDFIKFNVNDNGQGFPSGMPKSDLLKLGVSTRGEGSGFGLYYVSLVCKFLRSHLAIDSKPGNTNVAIYHPLNLT